MPTTLSCSSERRTYRPSRRCQTGTSFSRVCPSLTWACECLPPACPCPLCHCCRGRIPRITVARRNSIDRIHSNMCSNFTIYSNAIRYAVIIFYNNYSNAQIKPTFLKPNIFWNFVWSMYSSPASTSLTLSSIHAFSSILFSLSPSAGQGNNNCAFATLFKFKLL